MLTIGHVGLPYISHSQAKHVDENNEEIYNQKYM